MKTEISRLGSAQVRWNDYVGTAAADDADAVLNSRSLYEVAGLDRDRWAIVGIDLSLGDTAEPVVLYARDRSGDDAGTSSDTTDPSAETRVTAFHLGASTEVGAFLREAFRAVSVRLVTSAMADRSLVVTDHHRIDHG